MTAAWFLSGSPSWRRAVWLVGWWPVGLMAGTAQVATIHWLPEAQPAAVEVGGLTQAELRSGEGRGPGDSAWARLLAVYAEQGTPGETLPPMDGVWQVAGDSLRFEPRFPLTRGVRYRAEFRPVAGKAGTLVSYFELPADITPASTTVARVFPSADELPENQLKFYVQFSASMSRGGVYEHIRIRDAAGTAVELAFLELQEELWDPTMTRLTLLIDPGRIKRGVRPLDEVGPVFEAGKTYSLTVATACRDAAGRPLQAAFEKKIQVGPADRTPPNPARWKITAPAAGRRDALVIEFDESMDEALALRLIGVSAGAAKGGALAGETALAAQERRWLFVPDVAWARGPYRLVVATTVEDLAGNNIGKAFDVDQFERVNRRVATESVTVVFEVKE